jgi:uncharacterized membrane protein
MKLPRNKVINYFIAGFFLIATVILMVIVISSAIYSSSNPYDKTNLTIGILSSIGQFLCSIISFYFYDKAKKQK